MSAKFLSCLIACTLLLICFSGVNAQQCYSGANATTCSGTDCDFCGASLKTSSCCSATDVYNIKSKDNNYEIMKFPSNCRKLLQMENCARCYTSNSNYVNPDGTKIMLCKSFCDLKKAACQPSFVSNNMGEINCDGLDEKNCYGAGAINQISALVMIGLIVVLSVFAL